MIVTQRDIWLADLGQPKGSEAGYVRPVIVVQADALNISRMTSYVIVPLTSSVGQQSARWNLFLSAASTGLDRDSVALTHQITNVDEIQLIDRIGHISANQLDVLLERLDLALGRQ